MTLSYKTSLMLVMSASGLLMGVAVPLAPGEVFCELVLEAFLEVFLEVPLVLGRDFPLDKPAACGRMFLRKALRS